MENWSFQCQFSFGGVHSFGGCRIAPSYPAMDFSVCIFSVRPRGATSSFGDPAHHHHQSHHPHGIHGTGIWTYVYTNLLNVGIYMPYFWSIWDHQDPLPHAEFWPLISERFLSGTVDFCDVSWSIKHLVELERPKTRVFTPKKVAKLAKEGKSLHSRET